MAATEMRGALVILAVLLAGTPIAANWPQWRGPEGTGVSRTVGWREQQ
mgnify:CR=1 FL=1